MRAHTLYTLRVRDVVVELSLKEIGQTGQLALARTAYSSWESPSKSCC